MPAKDDSPPVSLFSFQDIITSITGIMFLVVLLLALVILDSSILNSADRETTSPEPQMDLVELKKKISALQQLLKDARKEIQTISMQMENAISLPSEKLDEKLALEQEKNSKLKQHLREMERIRRALREKNSDLKKESLRLAEELRKQDDQISRKKTELPKGQQELEKLKKQLERQKKLISYSVDSDFPKKLLIVECTLDGIRVKNTATGEIRSFVDKNDLTYASSITRFLAWMKTRNRQTEYFSLVITPGAFGYVNTLDQELVSAGFSRGREILPSNDSRIFEENP